MITSSATVTQNPVREAGKELRLLLEKALALPKGNSGVLPVLSLLVLADIDDATLGSPEWGYPSELAREVIDRLEASNNHNFVWLAQMYHDVGHGTWPRPKEELAARVAEMFCAARLIFDFYMSTISPHVLTKDEREVMRLTKEVLRVANILRELRTGVRYFSDNELGLFV